MGRNGARVPLRPIVFSAARRAAREEQGLVNGKDAPIGVFDSGVGGLTVVKSLRARLPNERIVYLGDTARIPYGTRSPATVERYALQNVRFLDTLGIKALVIACNTATALALPRLRALAPDLPTVGVIQPGARRAVETSHTKRIGVIGTEATVGSGVYEREILARAPEAKVVARACPLFVALAEEGWTTHAEATRLVAERYLEPFREAGVDTLVLGCTHYPILRSVIAGVMGESVALIDSGEAAAEDVADALFANGIAREEAGAPDMRFFVTDAAERFRRVAERFLEAPLDQFETVELTGSPT
jgi:glutamate racemase